MTSLYGNKILVHLFKSGYISVSEGFKVDNTLTQTVMNQDLRIKDHQTFKMIPKKFHWIYLKPILGRINLQIRKKNTENKESVEDKGGNTLWDPTQPSTSGYVRKFIWPDNFLNRESEKTDPFVPIESNDISKLSSQPFFGQVIELLGPRLNSTEQKGWNLRIKLGRTGVCPDMGLWFRKWSKKPRFLLSSGFLSSILGKLYHSIKNLKTSCIGKVSLVMSQIEEEVKEHGETKEKFSAMFQQPAKIRAKKCMREKSF